MALEDILKSKLEETAAASEKDPLEQTLDEQADNVSNENTGDEAEPDSNLPGYPIFHSYTVMRLRIRNRWLEGVPSPDDDGYLFQARDEDTLKELESFVARNMATRVH